MSEADVTEMNARNGADDVVLKMEQSNAPTQDGPETSPPKPSHPEISAGFPLEGPYLTAPPATGDHWERCHIAVERYDNDMCKSWREEIDTLLVFAGLFTAIVTAFTVESYQWLQPDPSDVTTQLLLHLSHQMANSSLPPASDPSRDFTIPAYAVRVNCFWFMSITISLAAGITGILCKQWMREYQRDAALPPKEALALRQLRYEGWKAWGVPHIISVPAILLQLSLLLFLGGVVDFLWGKFWCLPVAICTSVVVCLVAFSMGLTTVLPLVYFLRSRLRRMQSGITITISQCPFKSPQSYLLLRMWDVLGVPTLRRCRQSRWASYSFGTWLSMERTALAQESSLCGRRYTSEAIDHYRSKALAWVRRTLAFNSHIRDSLFYCFQESRIPCQQDDNRFHLSAPPTKEECEKNDFPAELLYSLYLREPFAAEIALRQLATRNTHRVKTAFWHQTFHPLQEPRIVAQMFNYAQYCCRLEASTIEMWRCILWRYLPQPSLDRQINDLAQTYLDQLSLEDDTRKGIVKCQEFAFALGDHHVLDVVKDAQRRPIFHSLMICLKRTRQRLKQPTSITQAWLIERVDDSIIYIVNHTSLRRDFFDDLDDESIVLPQVQPGDSGDDIRESPGLLA